METKQINIIDIFSYIVKWRKTLVITVVCAGILTAGISLLLPNYYKSTAIVLPPLQKGGMSFGLGGLGQISSNILSSGQYELPMLATKSDVYFTILQSRDLAVFIIEKFNLKERYREKYLDLAIKKYRRRTTIELSPDGSIHISFEAKKDPQFAAAVTNSIVAKLEEMNAKVMRSDAKFTREFVGGRLKETKYNLARAEDSLRAFQKMYGAVSVEEQTRATIESSAQLMAEMSMVKIQLSAIEKSYGSSNSQVELLKNKLKAYNEVISDIKTGSLENSGISKGEAKILLPLNAVPDLGLKMVRLVRTVKIQEILFELLSQQYEESKITEFKDTPSIQILQKASPETYKSRPKRSIIVLISVFLVFLIGVAIAVCLERYHMGIRAGDSNATKLQAILGELQNDFKKKRD